MSSDLRRQVQAATDEVKQTIDSHGQELSSDLMRQATSAKVEAEQYLRRQKEELALTVDDAKSNIEGFAKSCKEHVQRGIVADAGLFYALHVQTLQNIHMFDSVSPLFLVKAFPLPVKCGFIKD